MATRARTLLPLARQDLGFAGRGLRFGLSGAMVTVLYVATTAGLHEVAGAPFQLALVIGFVTATSLHFILQRVFVWVHADGFELGVRHQMGRYLPVAAVQYSAAAAATALLPGPLGVRVTYVYLATAALITIMSFLFFRAVVFHPKRASSPQ